METFDELQNVWVKQPNRVTGIAAADLMKRGERQVRAVRAGQVGTMVIISLLICALLGYFFAMNAHRVNGLTVGLTLMISVMIARVGLEAISIRRFRAIRSDDSLQQFSLKMKGYYEWRKKVHVVFIPVIYVLYIVGFTLLLPAFEANLSRGLYLYCLISGYGFLIVFAWFLIRILRKERALLDYLQKLTDD